MYYRCSTYASRSKNACTIHTIKHYKLEAKVMRYKQSLYEDWKDGEITREDYTHMSGDYEEQAARVKTVIATLKAELAKTENGIDIENPFLAAFRKHENIEKLTRFCRYLMVKPVLHRKVMIREI